MSRPPLEETEVWKKLVTSEIALCAAVGIDGMDLFRRERIRLLSEYVEGGGRFDDPEISELHLAWMKANLAVLNYIEGVS